MTGNGKTPLSQTLDEAEHLVFLSTGSKASAAGALLRRSIERCLALGIAQETVLEQVLLILEGK